MTKVRARQKKRKETMIRRQGYLPSRSAVHASARDEKRKERPDSLTLAYRPPSGCPNLSPTVFLQVTARPAPRHFNSCSSLQRTKAAEARMWWTDVQSSASLYSKSCQTRSRLARQSRVKVD